MAPAVGLIFSELLRFRKSGSGAPGARSESPESSPRLKTGPATLPG